VAEYFRHTGDRALVERQWPAVARAAAYLDSLRQLRRTPEWRGPGKAEFFGLLPPSISHEGYADKAAYSYWDDFWALRGFKDAVRIAEALGHADEAAAWAQQRDGFARELSASIAATARWHHIDHIAGAADRGDFDATSTTVALSPAEADLPRALLEATFERYWQEADARAQGRRPWKDYTPYELRTVGALVRLGQAERAQAMLRFFFADQRPAGWRQWAEVVLPDAREPHFLGDMPHAWVASDFLRSALDLFAYEREADASLVIGAGFTPDWRAAPLGVHGLSTAAGRFGYTLRPQPDGWRLEIDADAALPAGGLRLAWPGEGPLPQARQAGRALAWQGRELPLADATAVQLTTPGSTRSSE